MKKKFDLPKLISLNNFKDKRGSLARIFCTNEFTKKGINISIKQINHVIVKKKGTIKGMHFQLQPFSEMKIVKVIRGKIFDVVIDVRKNTKNFLSYKKFTLDSNENKCLITVGVKEHKTTIPYGVFNLKNNEILLSILI